MNKATLIAKIAEKSGLNKKQAEAALTAFTDTVVEALKAVTARTLVVAVDSVRLFFPEQVWQMAAGISGAFYREIHSDHGHDGFLIEHDQLTALLNEFLNERIPSRASSFA